MVHEKLFGLAPPPGRLLFEGQAYDIDWQGVSTVNMGIRDETVVLPTSDFALFLINTVKFRWRATLPSVRRRDLYAIFQQVPQQ